MDVSDAIRTVRVVRRFRDEPIAQDDITGRSRPPKSGGRKPLMDLVYWDRWGDTSSTEG
ncbi:MAG: hypothetical protein ABI744_04780 [Chloroflexota bacterium]